MPESDEKKYTLAEARIELRKISCEQFGHDFGVLISMGSNSPRLVVCNRCGLEWRVAMDASNA